MFRVGGPGFQGQATSVAFDERIERRRENIVWSARCIFHHPFAAAGVCTMVQIARCLPTVFDSPLRSPWGLSPQPMPAGSRQQGADPCI